MSDATFMMVFYTSYYQLLNMRPLALIARSHKPSWCGAVGGIKWNWMPFSVSNLSIRSLNTLLSMMSDLWGGSNKVSAVVKIDNCHSPLCDTKRIRAAMYVSVEETYN